MKSIIYFYKKYISNLFLFITLFLTIGYGFVLHDNAKSSDGMVEAYSLILVVAFWYSLTSFHVMGTPAITVGKYILKTIVISLLFTLFSLGFLFVVKETTAEVMDIFPMEFFSVLCALPIFFINMFIVYKQNRL